MDNQTTGQVSGVFTADDAAELILIILDSNIEDSEKIFYTSMLQSGAFNLEMYEQLMARLESSAAAQAEATKALEAQLVTAKQETHQQEQQLKESFVGAIQEMQAAVDFIEERTIQKAETLRVEHDASEIQNIKQNLQQ